jgi:hypothetical protein
MREQVGGGDANSGGGGGQLSLRLANVRTALQKIEWQAGGDGFGQFRQGARLRQFRGKILRVLTQQHRDAVLARLDFRQQWRQFRLVT